VFSKRGTGVSGNRDHDLPGLDRTLHDRVNDEIATVKHVLDDALTNPANATLDELYQATDSLMRSLARVLLAIERQRSSQ
jgi:hypothetical protein